MSLLTKASLVLTPNAIKSNKVYSIIPSNGNGDLTFTRDTAATQINSLGNVENVLTTIPRLNYDSVGGCPSLLLEPQRTNRLLNSAVVVTQTIATTGLACTVSFYGTGTIVFSGTYVGTLVGTGVNNRVTLTFTPTTGSLILTVTGSVTKGQLETGSYPTSYIPNTTIPLTRNADTFAINNIYTNNLITSDGGTWFIEINNNIPLIRDVGSNLFIGTTSNGNTNTSFGIRSSISASARLTLYKRELGTITAASPITTENAKILVKWNNSTADFFINGAKVVANIPHTATIMEFLMGDGKDSTKYIKSMLLFPTPLTDTECINLTTII